MSDIVEFLRVRLEESAQVVLRNINGQGLADGWPDYLTYVDSDTDAANDYIGHFDPTWALRDIESKRKILKAHDSEVTSDPFPEEHVFGFGCPTCHYERDFGVRDRGLCETIRLLALPFASHPDFDESWRPC